MALDLADVGSGAGYVYGGVAPEAATVTVVRKDGSRVDVRPVDRTLVHYLEAVENVARISFTTPGRQIDCVTGTPGMVFNCSDYPPEGFGPPDGPGPPPPIGGPCPDGEMPVTPSKADASDPAFAMQCP